MNKKFIIIYLFFSIFYILSFQSTYANEKELSYNVIEETEKETINNLMRDFFIGLQDKNYLKLNGYMIDKEEIVDFQLEEGQSIMDVSVLNGYKTTNNKYFIKMSIQLDNNTPLLFQNIYLEKYGDSYKLSARQFNEEIIAFPEIYKNEQPLFQLILLVQNGEWSKIKPIELEDEKFKYLTDKEIKAILNSDDAEELEKLKGNFYYEQLLAIYNNPYLYENNPLEEKMIKEKDSFLLGYQYYMPKELLADKGLQLLSYRVKGKLFSQESKAIYYALDFDDNLFVLNLSENQKSVYRYSFLDLRLEETFSNYLGVSMKFMKIVIIVMIIILVITRLLTLILPQVQNMEESNGNNSTNNSTNRNDVSNIEQSVSSILKKEEDDDINNVKETTNLSTDVNRTIVVEEEKEMVIEDIELDDTKRKIHYDE